MCRDACPCRAMDCARVDPTTDDDDEARTGGGTGDSLMPLKLYRRVMVAMNLPGEVRTAEEEVVGEGVGDELAAAGGA